MVRVVVAARTNQVSHALPVIVSDYLNGYSLSGDGAATVPPDFVSRHSHLRCHQDIATTSRDTPETLRS